MMWIKEINQTETNDPVYNLGFLYKSDKIYVMDNHLAAGWCWLNELDTKRCYNFFHIDRHYDLLNNESKEYLFTLKLEQKPSFQEYMSYKSKKTKSDGGISQLFRYDNYLMNIFYVLPNFFKNITFATHEEGTIPEDFDISYCSKIWALPYEFGYQINNSPYNNWILNIDIDFFFTDHPDSSLMQFLSDEYIDTLFEGILKVYDKIDIITIAMSPDYCNGWINSKRILDKIVKKLNLEINFPEPAVMLFGDSTNNG